jgi:hypothetical protein
MTPEEIRALQQDLHEAVESVLANHDAESKTYMMQFVLIAAVIDSDGQRGVWIVSADKMQDWELLGLLDYGKMQTYKETLSGDSDD